MNQLQCLNNFCEESYDQHESLVFDREHIRCDLYIEFHYLMDQWCSVTKEITRQFYQSSISLFVK